MNFYNRLLNFGLCHFAKLAMRYVFYSISDIVTERGLPYPDFNKGLVFITSQFGVEYAQNLPPNVKMIGPIFSTSRQASNPQLDEILDGALETNKSVIYLSLGTIVSIQPHSIEQLVKGLGMLNDSYVVVWSLRSHQQESVEVEIPKNIQVFNEQLPQLSLLSHPSVSLFLSHCGANSMIEALYFGKPILGLPVRGDQFGNAEIAVSLGAGESLDVTNLVATSVFETVNNILHSPKYRIAAEKISTILHQTRSLETGVREIEFFASIKDVSPFIPLSEKVPWYVRTHVDIFLFVVVLLIILWKLMVMFCRCTSKCFNRVRGLKQKMD